MTLVDLDQLIGILKRERERVNEAIVAAEKSIAANASAARPDDDKDSAGTSTRRRSR